MVSPSPKGLASVRSVRLLEKDGEIHAAFSAHPERAPLTAWLDPNGASNFAFGLGSDGTAFSIACPPPGLHRNEAAARAFAARLAAFLLERYDAIGVPTWTAPRHAAPAMPQQEFTNRAVHEFLAEALASQAALIPGATFHATREEGTTKTCSTCGTYKENKVHGKSWACACCGSALARDENAARNGLREMLESQGLYQGALPILRRSAWAWSTSTGRWTETPLAAPKPRLAPVSKAPAPVEPPAPRKGKKTPAPPAHAKHPPPRKRRHRAACG